MDANEGRRRPEPGAGPAGPRSAGQAVAEAAALVIAVLLHLVMGFFTLSSGLVAPLWGIVVLAVVWVVAVVVLVRLARRRPLLTPLVPIANGLLWWAALAAGGAWLGWSA